MTGLDLAQAERPDYLVDEDRAGHLIEYGPTDELFTNPKDKRTED